MGITLRKGVFSRLPSLKGVASTPDQRAELMLGALAVGSLVLIGFMIAFVMGEAWPSFANNGFFKWFGWGGNTDQQLEGIFNSPGDPASYVYEIRTFPLLYGTVLITGGAVIIATVLSVLSAVFIVEFAPEALRRALEPIVKLLAAVPSVIYGLIGILVIVPFFDQVFITEGAKESVQYVIQLTGSNITVAVFILTIMIAPIMIAIVVNALNSVPDSWSQGAIALGVNRWRAMWTVVVRAARPAIVAAAVLATARALGEAIMLSMVSGSVSFSPNPLDGLIFFLEPARPYAPAIVENSEGLTIPPFGQTIYAFAAVLLFSAGMLSFAGWFIRQKLRKYTLTPT